jgi:hypothetical protein
LLRCGMLAHSVFIKKRLPVRCGVRTASLVLGVKVACYLNPSN